MSQNDKKLQNSQNQIDSQIKASTKNKYKILEVIQIINSAEKDEKANVKSSC